MQVIVDIPCACNRLISFPCASYRKQKLIYFTLHRESVGPSHHRPRDITALVMMQDLFLTVQLTLVTWLPTFLLFANKVDAS